MVMALSARGEPKEKAPPLQAGPIVVVECDLRTAFAHNENGSAAAIHR